MSVLHIVLKLSICNIKKLYTYNIKKLPLQKLVRYSFVNIVSQQRILRINTDLSKNFFVYLQKIIYSTNKTTQTI